MKNALLGGVAAVLLAASTPALAASPVFSWTGCYVGGHAGYGWGGSQDWNGTSSGGFLTTTKRMDMNSASLGGAQIGCDYQIPGSVFVVGLDGSFSWMSRDSNKVTDGYHPGLSDSSKDFAKQKNLGLFTARLGWIGFAPQHQIYVRGGLATGNFDFKNDYSGNTYTGSDNRRGWVGGIGWEWLAWQNVSVFVEYDHVSFGSKKEEMGGYFADVDMSGSNIVKAGVNWRLWTP